MRLHDESPCSVANALAESTAARVSNSSQATPGGAESRSPVFYEHRPSTFVAVGFITGGCARRWAEDDRIEKDVFVGGSAPVPRAASRSWPPGRRTAPWQQPPPRQRLLAQGWCCARSLNIVYSEVGPKESVNSRVRGALRSISTRRDTRIMVWRTEWLRKPTSYLHGVRAPLLPHPRPCRSSS